MLGTTKGSRRSEYSGGSTGTFRYSMQVPGVNTGAGEGGLLGRLTKMVIEGALEGELDDHLGYGKHDPEGRDGGNSRNGHRAKTVLTDTGPVEISVPRDRDSSFDPKIIAKRQRRLTGVDDAVAVVIDARAQLAAVLERDEHPVGRLVDGLRASEIHADGGHSIEGRALRVELPELLH